METLHIHRATPADLSILQALSKHTFIETFASCNSEADMQKYLEENLSLPQLSLELENIDSHFYLAFAEGELIGYLKLNFVGAQTDIHDPQTLEIERIYVLKQFHGKGWGRSLYEHALAIARERQFRAIWLGVWEHNLPAIRFYEKLGFEPFGQHSFFLGNDEQTDILMRKWIDLV